MLLKCFKQGSADVRVTYRKTCVVKWLNKSEYVPATAYIDMYEHILNLSVHVGIPFYQN